MPIPMPITDSIFLLAESREHPVHVGGLQLFDLPEGAGPDYLGDLHRKLVACDAVDRRFRNRAWRGVSSLGQWSWVPDEQLDLEYHVRLSALPRPGRIRELLELVSGLHGSLLDRHRPLWESHLIEGVEDGRFAVYSKVHHAVYDGVSALARFRRALSEDPDARDQPPIWALESAGRVGQQRPPRDPGLNALVRQSVGNPLQTGGTVARAAGEALGIGAAALGAVRNALSERAATLPMQAPRTMLNGPITGARRFAAQSWSLGRINKVRKATGCTVNDVVLAMCSGALRRYLLEFDALPDRPMTAMVPISLRAPSDAGGNAVGAILCNLATDTEDPAVRLERIRASMLRGKEAFAGLSPLQITALSAAIVAPLLAPMLPGGTLLTPPGFNLIISNIPGPPRPLYWEGARLRGLYPVSVPVEGQALNITVTSYADNIEFGLTGCRRSVPHLQRLLLHLEDSLAELEVAVSAVSARSTGTRRGGTSAGGVRAGRQRSRG